jgi:hypothetical protein
MAINQGLADILDGAVRALINSDTTTLRFLEQQIIALAGAYTEYDGDSIGLVLSRKRQLEIVLQNFQVNLDTLTRLHARNMRNQWAQ